MTIGHSNCEAKKKYRGMFETQKVRRHDKFRKEWSQHKNKCKSQMGTMSKIRVRSYYIIWQKGGGFLGGA